MTLFAGFGGVVTLLYLLRLRRRRVEVPFGPLWQKVLNEKQTTSLFRVLKRFFSLLMQLAFIALILTAIANPRWTGDGTLEYQAAQEKEPIHTLLVVDTSASMRAADISGGRAAAATQAAHKVVDAMQRQENLMLARMDRDMAVLTDWTRDRDALPKRINAIRPNDAGTSILPLMQFARNALRGLSNPQIVLVTDQGFVPPDKALAKSLKLQVINVGSSAKTANVAVLDFNVRSHLGNALKYALYYKLKNFSDMPVTVNVYLHSADDGAQRGDFETQPPVRPPSKYKLEPGQTRVIEELAVDVPGSRAALIVSPSQASNFTDVLAADNVAYAVVPRRKQVKVQVVGPPNLFLEAALMTRSHVDYKRVAATEYTGGADFDLTVFYGAAPKAGQVGNAMYINAVGPGAPYALKGKGTARGGSVTVPSARRRHPLMKFVRFVDLVAPRIQRFKSQRGLVAMARSRGGKPAIIAHAGRKNRWIAVGFDPVATEWVGHYSFSIFFVNAINWFFQEEAALLRPWSLAERWDVVLPWRGIESANVTLPDGSRQTALVDGGGTLAFTGQQQGIYEVHHPKPSSGAQREPTLIAASLRNETESSLVPKGEYTAWKAPEAVAEDVPKLSLMGADLWQLLLIIALALMVVEWFTYHRRWTV